MALDNSIENKYYYKEFPLLVTVLLITIILSLLVTNISHIFMFIIGLIFILGIPFYITHPEIILYIIIGFIPLGIFTLIIPHLTLLPLLGLFLIILLLFHLIIGNYKIRLNRIVKYSFFLLLILILFSTIMGIDYKNSFWWLKSIVQMMILSLIIPILLNNRAKIETVGWVIIASCTFASLLTILSKFQFLPFSLNEITYGAANIERQSGTANDPNYFAAQLSVGFAFSLSFLLYSKNNIARILLIPVTIVLLAGIISTISLGAIIGLISLLLIYFFHLIKLSITKLIIILCSLLTMFLILLSLPGMQLRINQEIESSHLGFWRIGSERILTWTASANLTIHHPLLGVGIGNHQFVTKYYDPFNVMKLLENDEKVAHNMYLSFAADNGIPALFVFMSLLLYLLVQAYKASRIPSNIKHINFAVFSALSCFMIQNIFLDGWSEKYLWVLIGLSISVIFIQRQQKDSQLNND